MQKISAALHSTVTMKQNIRFDEERNTDEFSADWNIKISEL